MHARRSATRADTLQEELRACRLQLQGELDVNLAQRVRLLVLETRGSAEALLQQLVAPRAGGSHACERDAGAGAGARAAGELEALLERLTRFVKDRYGRARRTCPLGPFLPARALLDQ